MAGWGRGVVTGAHETPIRASSHHRFRGGNRRPDAGLGPSDVGEGKYSRLSHGGTGRRRALVESVGRRGRRSSVSATRPPGGFAVREEHQGAVRERADRRPRIRSRARRGRSGDGGTRGRGDGGEILDQCLGPLLEPPSHRAAERDAALSRRRAQVALALVALLAALAIVEASLRMFVDALPLALAIDLATGYNARRSGIYRFQSDMDMFLMRPHSEREMFFDGYHWHHRTDWMGFRNPEDRKSADVVLLGDSMVYGHGLEE